jgi:hypothetical protein
MAFLKVNLGLKNSSIDIVQCFLELQITNSQSKLEDGVALRKTEELAIYLYHRLDG